MGSGALRERGAWILHTNRECIPIADEKWRECELCGGACERGARAACAA
jgi:hypothetical protein